MNKKQRLVIYFAISVIIISLIMWLMHGGEIFTKNQVLVEMEDELFGFELQQWEDKFIWGLDLSLLISGITVLFSSILLFIFKNKKQEKT